MDCLRGQLAELDDCLYNFNVLSFYHAAIELFKALDFPVKEIEGYYKLSIEELLIKLEKSEDFINPSEKSAASMIKTVSILFVLNNDNTSLEYVTEYNDGLYAGGSIIVMGVELLNDDDYYEVPNITNLLNRLVNTQVFTFFKKESKISFSVKRRRINKKDETLDAKGSNFQTQWYETLPPDPETIFKIMELSFENFRDENFYFMYSDIVRGVAEEYLIEDFPQNDNISSHVKITDGVALYFRGIENLDCIIFKNNFNLCNENIEFEFEVDEQLNYTTMALSENNNLFLDTETVASAIELEDNFNEELNQIMNNTEIAPTDLEGGANMDEIIKKIMGDFKILSTDLESLFEFIDEYRKNDQHMSVREKREQSEDCFEKMEIVEAYVNEIGELKERFIGSIQQRNNKETTEKEKYRDDTLVSEGEISSYKHTSPYKVSFLGVDYSVRNWTDVLTTVCETLLKTSPEQVSIFDKNPLLKGTTRQYFSYDKTILTDHAKKLSNDLYAETNFSSDDIVKICKTLIEICGYEKNQISFCVNRTRKTENITTDNISRNIDSDGLEIKFLSKYSSISVSEGLLKIILLTISEYANKGVPYIESSSLKDELSEIIETKSSYKQPQHVLNNVIKFLMDWDVITLYDGAKRGKYAIKDKGILEEMINDSKMIIELLRNE